MNTIEEALRDHGVFVTTTVGVSMEPLFKNRRDTVQIMPVTGRLSKYDVPLYRRRDEYVLHRIIKVLPDSYVICGDNCIGKEYGITDDDIVGVMVAFDRKGKHYTVNHFGYRLYARLRVAQYPFRLFWVTAKSRVAKCIKRMVKRAKE